MMLLTRPLFAVAGFNVKVWMLLALIVAILAVQYFKRG